MAGTSDMHRSHRLSPWEEKAQFKGHYFPVSSCEAEETAVFLVLTFRGIQWCPFTCRVPGLIISGGLSGPAKQHGFVSSGTGVLQRAVLWNPRTPPHKHTPHPRLWNTGGKMHTASSIWALTKKRVLKINMGREICGGARKLIRWGLAI